MMFQLRVLVLKFTVSTDESTKEEEAIYEDKTEGTDNNLTQLFNFSFKYQRKTVGRNLLCCVSGCTRDTSCLSLDVEE